MGCCASQPVPGPWLEGDDQGKQTRIILPFLYSWQATDDILSWMLVDIPPSLRARPADMRFRFRWKDQGFGERNGRLKVRAPNGPWHDLTSTPAPHDYERADVSMPAAIVDENGELPAAIEIGFTVGGPRGKNRRLVVKDPALYFLGSPRRTPASGSGLQP